LKYIIRHTYTTTDRFIREILGIYINNSNIKVLSKMRHVKNMILVKADSKFNIYSIKHDSIDKIIVSEPNNDSTLDYVREQKFDVPWHIRHDKHHQGYFPSHSYDLGDAYVSQLNTRYKTYSDNIPTDKYGPGSSAKNRSFVKYASKITEVRFISASDVVSKSDGYVTNYFSSSQRVFGEYSTNPGDLPLNWGIGRCTLPNDDLIEDQASIIEEFVLTGSVESKSIMTPIGIQSLEWDIEKDDSGAFNTVENTNQWLSTTEPDDVEWPVVSDGILFNPEGNTPSANDPIAPINRGCTSPLAVNYDPSIIYDDGSCIFTPSNNTSPEQTQVIYVKSGSNFISSYINLHGKKFSEIFTGFYFGETFGSSITTNWDDFIDNIQDVNGNIFKLGSITNTLEDYWYNNKGFIVNAKQPFWVSITGNVIKNQQIIIEPGNSVLMPYLSTEVSRVEDLFGSELSNINSILSSDGKVYTENINTGLYLTPGNSYLIEAQESVLVVFSNNIDAVVEQSIETIDLSNQLLNNESYNIPNTYPNILASFSSTINNNRTIRNTITNNLYYPDEQAISFDTSLNAITNNIITAKSNSVNYEVVDGILAAENINLKDFIIEIRNESGKKWNIADPDNATLLSLQSGRGYYINSNFNGELTMSWAPYTITEPIHLPPNKTNYFAYIGPLNINNSSEGTVLSSLAGGSNQAGNIRGNLAGTPFSSSIVSVEDGDGNKWTHTTQNNPSLKYLEPGKGYKIITSGSYGIDLQYPSAYNGEVYLNKGWNLIGYIGPSLLGSSLSNIRIQSVPLSNGMNYISSYIDLQELPVRGIVLNNIKWPSGNPVSIEHLSDMNFQLQNSTLDIVTAGTLNDDMLWNNASMYKVTIELNMPDPFTDSPVSFLTLEFSGNVIDRIDITVNLTTESWLGYPLTFQSEILSTYTSANNNHKVQTSPTNTIDASIQGTVDSTGIQTITLSTHPTSAGYTWIILNVLPDNTSFEYIFNNYIKNAETGEVVQDAIQLIKENSGNFWTPDASLIGQDIQVGVPYQLVASPSSVDLVLEIPGTKQSTVINFNQSVNNVAAPNFPYFHDEALPITHLDNPIRPLLPYIIIVKDVSGLFWTPEVSLLNNLIPGNVYFVSLTDEYFNDPFPFTYEVEGLKDTTKISPGQGIVFLNPDKEQLSFTFDNNINANQPTQVITSATQLQTIEIEPGWSMISSYLDIEEYYADDFANYNGSSTRYLFDNFLFNSDGNQVLNPLDGEDREILLIKNYLGVVTGGDFDALDWNNMQGYQIKNETDETLYLHLSGSIIRDTTQEIIEGWQIIPVLHPVERPIEEWAADYFSNIDSIDVVGDMPDDAGNGVSSDVLDIMKDDLGAVWIPAEQGGPENAGFNTITPGKAYQLKTYEAFNIPIINTEFGVTQDTTTWLSTKVPPNTVPEIINEVVELDYNDFLENTENYFTQHTPSQESPIYTQKIPLNEGWNTIGTYIDIGPVDIQQVIEQNLYWQNTDTQVNNNGYISAITYVNNPTWTAGQLQPYTHGADLTENIYTLNAPDFEPIEPHIPTRGYKILVNIPYLEIRFTGPLVDIETVTFSPGAQTMYFPTLTPTSIAATLPGNGYFQNLGYSYAPYLLKNGANVFWPLIGTDSLSTFSPNSGFTFQWDNNPSWWENNSGEEQVPFHIPTNLNTITDTTLGVDAGDTFNLNKSRAYLIRFSSEFHANRGYKLKIPGNTFAATDINFTVGDNIFSLPRNVATLASIIFDSNIQNIVYIKEFNSGLVIWVTNQPDIYLYPNIVYIVSVIEPFSITI